MPAPLVTATVREGTADDWRDVLAGRQYVEIDGEFMVQIGDVIYTTPAPRAEQEGESE